MTGGGPDDEFMRALARRVGAALGQEDPVDQFVGRHVGAYRLLHEIGRGGMGAVYLAERADQHFEKRVAIKLLPVGPRSAATRARFEAERRILARLEHPGIARLLDGGVTEDDVPYFVMEYVQGTPITTYCRDRALSLEARLRLFVQVCEAVDHAHRSLVVHRDLKPGNLFVSDTGEPKLLDFGIAKLEAPDLTGETVPLTERSGLPMTLAYASPEQARGEAVTTATDVHALGLMLFELLTGAPARQLTGELLPDVAALAAQEPPRPSAVANMAGIDARRLRGDLDTIVAMATRLEPAGRYRSAAALAEDVRRHLAAFPVRARPATLGYRLRTLARRRPGLVGLASAGAVGLVAFIVMLAVGMRRIADERTIAVAAQREAEAARGRAEQATGFLYGLFQSADPRRSLGATVTARELLDRGLEQAAILDADPVAQSELLSVLAGVHDALGLPEQAAEIAERALIVRRRHHGEGHPDVARSLYQLGTIAAPRLIAGPALDHLERALAIQRSVLGPDHPETAQTMVALAPFVRRSRNAPDSAAVLARRALDIQRRSLGDSSPVLLPALGLLSTHLRATGEVVAADSLARWRLAIRARHARSPLEQAAVHVERALLLQYAPATLPGAIAEMDRALALSQPILLDHPQVVQDLLFAAALRARTGDDRVARRQLEAAMAIGERLGTPVDAALAWATYLVRKDEAEAAAQVVSRVLARADPEDRTIPFTLYRIGAIAHLHRGQPRKAVPLAKEAYHRHQTLLRAVAGGSSPLDQMAELALSESRLWYGVALARSGAPDSATALLTHSIGIGTRYLWSSIPSGARAVSPMPAGALAVPASLSEGQRALVSFHVGLAETSLGRLWRCGPDSSEALALSRRGRTRVATAISDAEELQGPFDAVEMMRRHEQVLLSDGAGAPAC